MSFRVYLITPDAGRSIVGRVESALAGAPRGQVAVQLRDKSASSTRLAAAARELLPVARRAGALLFINGSVDLALEVGADGVQLPERAGLPADVPAGLLVGCSRHDRDGLLDLESADFATLGPIGRVPGKNPPLGVSGFRRAVEGVALPVYGLGGVDTAHARALRAAGAAGVAVIRSVFDAADPAGALAALCAAAGE